MPEALPPEHDHPGVPIAPPLLFVIPLAALLVLEAFWPTSFVEGPLRWGLGGLLLATGLAFALGGYLTQTRAGTSPLPDRPSTRIVDTGLYGMTRNPMYVGFALVAAGAATLIDSAWGLLAAPIAVILLDRIVIVREERYLERKFGDEYRAYKSRVRRWL